MLLKYNTLLLKEIFIIIKQQLSQILQFVFFIIINNVKEPNLEVTYNFNNDITAFNCIILCVGEYNEFRP